jgi:hypothetical protein
MEMSWTPFSLVCLLYAFVTLGRGGVMKSLHSLRGTLLAATALGSVLAASIGFRRRRRSLRAKTLRAAQTKARTRPVASATSPAGHWPTPAGLALATPRRDSRPMPAATPAPATSRRGSRPMPAATAAATSRRGPAPMPVVVVLPAASTSQPGPTLMPVATTPTISPWEVERLVPVAFLS